MLLEKPPWNSLWWFSGPGAWFMHFDLLHGCDNMINRLTNKVKVLAWSLFLTMVLFETSSQLKLHLHQNSSQMWSFLIRLGQYYNSWSMTCWSLWWFFTSGATSRWYVLIFKRITKSLSWCLPWYYCLFCRIPNSAYSEAWKSKGQHVSSTSIWLWCRWA
jgi:hypothetical protein